MGPKIQLDLGETDSYNDSDYPRRFSFGWTEVSVRTS